MFFFGKVKLLGTIAKNAITPTVKYVVFIPWTNFPQTSGTISIIKIFTTINGTSYVVSSKAEAAYQILPHLSLLGAGFCLLKIKNNLVAN